MSEKKTKKEKIIGIDLGTSNSAGRSYNDRW